MTYHSIVHRTAQKILIFSMFNQAMEGLLTMVDSDFMPEKLGMAQVDAEAGAATRIAAAFCFTEKQKKG